MNSQYEWDLRYLGLAEHVASWSKDPSTKVGAVIFDQDGRMISIGYNGLPQGIKDSGERLNNRELKYKIIVHAEMNAIFFADHKLEGCSIATWPFMPCSNCASAIIQNKIKRVIAPFNDNPRWKDSFALSQELFEETGIELILI